MKRTPMPPRVVPLRRTPLQLGPGPERRNRIKPVSAARARENRTRAQMADRRWPDRREGTVMCECGRAECNRRADDLHESLSRARSGGSITDPAIWKALSRHCHDEATFKPESELDWAYRNGVLKHSGACCRDRDICAQYADEGDAA